MFVRKRKVTKEVEFKENLENLGLFVNKQDQIRQIANPEEGFNYKVYKKPRWNERRREAHDACIRKIVAERLEALGLQKMQLTQGTHHAHVPIYVSSDLRENKSKVLVLVPGDDADLGFWSYRAIGLSTINEGSMVNMVKKAREQGYSVIIANTGALRYDLDLKTTVTLTTWNARRKPWRLGGPIRDFDVTWNCVPGNMTSDEHVAFVFDNVVKKLVPQEAQIYIVAAYGGATSVINYLEERKNWDKFKSQLYAMATSESAHYVAYLKNLPLRYFLEKYTRAYVTNGEPRGNQVPDSRYGCATYSSETIYYECCIPFCGNLIMDYFVLAREDHFNCNPMLMFEVGGKGDGIEVDQVLEKKERLGDAWDDDDEDARGIND